MDNTFEIAFNDVIIKEGCFTSDPNDRGNWTSGVVGKGELKGTKYGISAMSYPRLDIKNLTPDDVKAIYYRDFWAEYSLDLFEPVLSLQLFDAIVQHGASNAIKMLQKALGLTPNGLMGVSLTNAVRASNQKELALKFISQRLSFYAQIKTFNLYGKGWVNRMVKNLNQTITYLH